ncbi:efflux RND transporter periplasmic adaptor subunit [Alkaliphilus peptidifermentans]|uniref:Membrane fusion protein, cobalt-zinc-cadmium efflux system n=1 Tax=Alkaliphilus peptidifermentans DSM 18978 TaxID=1120976 RepID=A0A1G5F3G3_9FIRM|nr:efflux RND transporter periplasmic adaptor subunit [Alkaliphilus peptidifermentans]SCY33641.1 membrane fusion protein, cobalt-zinc-cadmium efflux system [Alkaliphilus peptidifermentans DSM 18978]
MKVKKIIGTILVISLVITTIVGCGSKEQEEVTIQLTSVEAYNAKVGNIQHTYNATGSIKPVTEVSIVPKVAGKVDNIMKKMGDKVSQDEILFTIDNTNLYQQLEQYDAQQRQQLMLAESSLKQQELQYNTAKEDYIKNEALFEAQAISQQILESYKKALEIAELNYMSAQESYYLLQNKILLGIEEDGTKQLKETKSIIETQREATAQSIRDSEVKSPISGIVIQRNVEVGEIASQQMPAFIIVDIDRVVVETSVTEKMINSISKGQEIVVTIKALDGKKFNGIVDTISPAVSGQSVGYPVKIVIDNINHELKPGMFAEVSFVIENKENVLLVPMESVLTTNKDSYVYLLNDDDTVSRKLVKTGHKDGKYFEIIDGLKEGDPVLVKGQHFVLDGEKVHPVGGAQ